MAEELKTYPITHAMLAAVRHPGLGVTVQARSAVRFLRFLRRARVERLELPYSVYGRATPRVPCHPAHISVATLDPGPLRWRTVREFDLPFDPRIAGEGLSQKMSVQQMEERLGRVLQEPPRVLDLGGVETECLRVECDREQPVWPNHGECNGGPLNVPFGILNPLRAFGKARGPAIETPYHPPLAVRAAHPRAPRGMKVRDLPHMLLFEGRFLSIGFSLRRPLLMHLGWDALGGGQAGNNRILASHCGYDTNLPCGGLSGPLARTLTLESGCHLWSGEVSVEGNRVVYRNLSGVPGLIVDATFTVEPKRVLIELRQRCARALAVLESEAWRLCWNEAAGITGAAALPIEADLPAEASAKAGGRSGEVQLPMMWASDGVGCLSCRPFDVAQGGPEQGRTGRRLEGDPAESRLQIESYRSLRAVTGGFVLAPRPRPDAPLVLPQGERRAVFELAVTNLQPDSAGRGRAPLGIRRQWASTFACFRPELRGFSNHAASVNCHLSQLTPVLIATATRRPKHGPDPVRLAQFTIATALLDGGGYGYWRNLYLDSDPNLVAAAGLIHAARPDLVWLRRIEPGLRAAMGRICGTLGRNGLAVCRDLSGISGSYRWSTNGMDVVGFGHLDAYANALTYMALRSAGKLYAALNDRTEAAHARDSARRLKAAFPRFLLNRRTGWVAGWRSRDGALHDAAFSWVNGVALTAGLLPPAKARKALRNLERARARAGAGSARIGLPFNFLPLDKRDHMLPVLFGESLPTFENYTDGSMSGWSPAYYLRALQKCGLRRAARKIAAEMNEGYALGMHSGGMGTGIEFRSWEGLPCGYEGTLIGCFGTLYAIAIGHGLIEPLDPELY